MADVVVTISITDVSFTTWLKTSIIGMTLDKDKVPMLLATEMGPDQVDAFTEFMKEASREVLKVFVSRQGNASGVPFEQTATDVIYRFKEETPILPQADAIKDSLNEDTRNALYVYVTLLWFKLKGNKDQLLSLIERYEKLTGDIERHLYKLHD